MFALNRSSKRQSKNDRKAGFSLVEALISLAIASVIIISLFDGFSTALRTARMGYCQAKGAMIGEKYASQLKAGLDVPSTIKEGNWTVKLVQKNTSDGEAVSFFKIYLGEKKCIDVPIR